MEEKCYYISEVSKMVGVEPHVLRYWEEEMRLEIQRNSQGKRCYTSDDVEQLRRIKYWKDKGMQLKAVKEVMEEQERGEARTEATEEAEKISCDLITVESPSDSMKRFEEILDGIIGQALERNNEKLIQEICDTILRELDDKLEERLEELLQKEALREMERDAEPEVAASRESRRRRRGIREWWKRWIEGRV